MAIVVFPVDAVAGSPSYTGRMARQTLAPLLAGATAARPLGARSGVRPGTSATTVTATSTVWTVDLHAGILDLEASGLVGPYAYAVNTAQTGAMTAAHATLPRIDIVWVRIDDPAESDGSAVPAVVAGYTAGVAATAGTQVAPATPARSMVLATINVPLSGGGAPTVVWAAPYTVAAGAQIPVWSQAERDALTLRDGLHVYRLDLHVAETYNGTTWTSAIFGADTTSPAANAFTAGKTILTQVGRLSVTTDAAGKYLLTLPKAFPNGLLFVMAQGAESSQSQKRIWTPYPTFGSSVSQCWMVLSDTTTGAAVLATSLMQYVAYGF